MQLTDKQIQLLIDFAIYFTFTVGAMTIIRAVFRLIRSIIKKLCEGIRRMRIRRQAKNHNGHKNFKDNTWYADGTIYHPDTKEFEKADYNK